MSALTPAPRSREDLKRRLEESLDAVANQTEGDDPQEDARLAALRALVPLIGPDLGGTILDRLRQRHLALAIALERMMGDERCRALLPKISQLVRWYVPARVSDEVYCAHVNEIFDRYIERKSLQPGTRAEALTAIGSAIACGVPDEEVRNLLLALCWEVLGDAFCGARGFPRKPSWTVEMWELFTSLSKRRSVPERNLGWP